MVASPPPSNLDHTLTALADPTRRAILHRLAGGEARPETMFLDDLTLAELERDLGVPVVPSGENLSQLLDHLRAAEARRTDWHTSLMTQPQGAYLP